MCCRSLAWTPCQVLRTFRVFRLIKRIPAVRRIVTALFRALPAMVNALTIVFVLMSVYAVLAVRFFRDDKTQGAEYFGNFSMSFFTMIQVVSGDGWVSNVSREIFENREEAEMDAQVLHLHVHMCTHAYMRVCMNVYVSMYTVRKFVPRWTFRSPSFSAATTLWLRWSS